MQAAFEFFIKRLVNQTLPRHAREPLESCRYNNHMIMCLAAGARTRVSRVLCAFVRHREVNWRQSVAQRVFNALGARKMCFVGCQWIVRLTLGAHTRLLDVRRIRLSPEVCRYPRQET